MPAVFRIIFKSRKSTELLRRKNRRENSAEKSLHNIYKERSKVGKKEKEGDKRKYGYKIHLAGSDL